MSNVDSEQKAAPSMSKLELSSLSTKSLNYVAQNDSSPSLKPSRRVAVAKRQAGAREKITWWFRRQLDSQEASCSSSPAKPSTPTTPTIPSPDFLRATPADSDQKKKQRRARRRRKSPTVSKEDPVQQDTSTSSSFPTKPLVFPQKKGSSRSKPNDSTLTPNLSQAKKTSVAPEVAAASSISVQHAAQEEQGKMGEMPTSKLF